MNSYIKNQIAIVSLLIIVTSCAPINYYQLLDVAESAATPPASSALEITNEFWSEGGTITSYLKNTTDKVLYIDLANSHLIVNGYAYTYYRGSLSASTINRSSAVANTNPLVNPYRTRLAQTSVETTQTVVEQRIIILPPKSIKTVTSSSLRSTPYRNCDLILYPRKKDVASLSFSENNSPFTFRTMFSYGQQESNTGEFTFQENIYFISGVSNYSSTDFVQRYFPENCGKKSINSVPYQPYYAPNKFYVKYSTSL